MLVIIFGKNFSAMPPGKSINLVVPIPYLAGDFCRVAVEDIQKKNWVVEVVTDPSHGSPEPTAVVFLLPDGFTLDKMPEKIKAARLAHPGAVIGSLSETGSDEIKTKCLMQGADDCWGVLDVGWALVVIEARSAGKKESDQQNAGTSLVEKSGFLRRGDFLKHLGDMLARDKKPWMTLLCVRVDQMERLKLQLGRTQAYELEKKIVAGVMGALSENDSHTVWLEFELGVLIERDDKDQVLDTSKQICEAVARMGIQPFETSEIITVSVGMALVPEVKQVDRWFSAAYAAQAIAHRLGGNRVDGILSADYGDMPAERALIIREWVKDAAKGEAITIEFQPMLPLHGHLAGMYMLHAKLRDFRAPLAGVPRHEYLKLARIEKAMFMIDRVSFFHAVEALDEQKNKGLNTKIVVPIDLDGLNDQQWFWMTSQLRRKSAADRLVIEIDAETLLGNTQAEEWVKKFKDAGVFVGVSDMLGGISRVDELMRFSFDFLRVPHEAVSGVAPGGVDDIMKNFRDKDGKLIVDEVKTVDDMAHLWGLGVSYLQGSVLAESSPRLDYDFSS